MVNSDGRSGPSGMLVSQSTTMDGNASCHRLVAAFGEDHEVACSTCCFGPAGPLFRFPEPRAGSSFPGCPTPACPFRRPVAGGCRRRECVSGACGALRHDQAGSGHGGARRPRRQRGMECRAGDIRGFSQTHVSGTGGGAKYGNILVQATTGDVAPDGLNLATRGREGFGRASTQ